MVVYPRWRGELFCALAFCWLSRGLSPLARGTLCRCQHCWRVIRFIPAGAGNTVPRIISLFFDGLSPLARGTRRQRIVRLPLHRFIPAGAGNTSTLSITTDGGAGLSPLARGTLAKQTSGYAWCRFIPAGAGTLNQAVLFFQRRRFIPAGAGNTPKEIASQLNLPVYPRWRGEHKIHIDKHRVCIGLSPLARGTQIWGAPLMKSKRFIPAGAGNTRQLVKLRQLLPVYPRWRGNTRR